MTTARKPSCTNGCLWWFRAAMWSPFLAYLPTQPLRTSSSRFSWSAHKFCLPDLASSHWVHSLCLDSFVCVRLFSCIISACMLYYCNAMRRAWLDWGLSGWLTALLPRFDTVGWVIRPVKTVGHITYIVLVQTLNHAESINLAVPADQPRMGSCARPG